MSDTASIADFFGGRLKKAADQISGKDKKQKSKPPQDPGNAGIDMAKEAQEHANRKLEAERKAREAKQKQKAKPAATKGTTKALAY